MKLLPSFLILALIFCVSCQQILAEEDREVTEASLVKRTSTAEPETQHFKKTTNKHTTPKKFHYTTPKHKICHPFLPFCIPCHIFVNVARAVMDRIVFVHKIVENACTHILGRHFICDALIKVTMFYLDHTPTDKICRRMFFCSNDGFLDWWKTKQIFPVGTTNATLWTVLTTRDGNLPDKRFFEVRNSIHAFVEEFVNGDAIYDAIPPESIHQTTGLLFAIQKAAETYHELGGEGK